MKIDRRRTHILLLLLTSLASSQSTPANAAAEAKSLAAPRAVGDSLQPAAGIRAAPVGTEHAPVDGRDGMPHEGPFIETERDRSRKKGSDQEETLGGKVLPSGTPKTNDGVMDDPARKGPLAGTRGTEGGVTEKSKDGQIVDRQPQRPKEQPALPDSEKEKAQGSDGETVFIEEDGTKKTLTTPTDMPQRPHGIPHPENPSSPKDTTILPDKSWSTTDPSSPSSEHEPAVISPIHSLFLAFTMILFSEIGDKTFLVACLMAMRHDRLLVFTAAFSALCVMTVLSAILGHTVPTLIPKSITNFLAAGLFLVFGVRMLLEARKISPDEGVSEEMKEVEMELEEKEHQAARRAHRRSSSVTLSMLESGRGPRSKHTSAQHNRTLPSPPSSPSSTSSSRDASPSRSGLKSHLTSAVDGISNLLSLLLSPAWVQTFTLTFLGEWGDRSQIATIAMAAGQDYWWVTAGALGGHCICTGVAVIGGKAIAGRVSLRTVTMGGAVAFLVFGVIYLAEALW